MFNCVRSSILANSVEIFADVHICFVADNFYFLIFEKHNSKIGELSSRKLHSGTFHCPGMDLAGTRDISFHSGTVPGNPGHLVTLVSHLNLEIVHSKKDSDARQANILYARHDRSDGSGTELSLSNSVLKLRVAVHCFIRSLHDYYLFSESNGVWMIRPRKISPRTIRPTDCSSQIVQKCYLTVY